MISGLFDIDKLEEGYSLLESVADVQLRNNLLYGESFNDKGDIDIMANIFDLNSIINTTLGESAEDNDYGDMDNELDDLLNTPLEESSTEGDSATISIPASKEISADVYNDAIKKLVASFKENTDSLVESTQMLLSYKIVPSDPQNDQKQYTEALVEEAIYNSLINGPIFEAVNKSDKNEIKKIVQDIRNGIKNGSIPNKYGITPSNKFGRISFQNRMWQTIGYVSQVDKTKVDTIRKYYQNAFGNKLGEFGLSFVKVNMSIGGVTIIGIPVEMLIRYLGSTYLLVVDNKDTRIEDTVNITADDVSSDIKEDIKKFAAKKK